jgi:fructose 1,6-bisphosphate aldolase/phosphatase
MVTLSLIKADIGGFPGHSGMHPNLMEIAKNELNSAKASGLLKDFRVMNCGDDLQLIMLHAKGEDNEEIHKLAWDTFMKGTQEAKRLRLYGAGQDLLTDAFSGNVRGSGPGAAEMEFEVRESEPIVCFMSDKTAPNAFNLPIFRMFADPFCTSGLVIDPSVHEGFSFEVHDVIEGEKITLSCPNEIYDLLSLIGLASRYVIKRVTRNTDGEIAGVVSTEKLSYIAGSYKGKDDSVAIVRTQSGFPALGETLEPFAHPHLVEGWMRGSHFGPLMPTSFEQSTPVRFDGPPRIIAAGFQLTEEFLVGPADLFKDPSFHNSRKKALDIADYMRRHGPFQPHLTYEDALEYTQLPEIKKRLKERFQKLDDQDSKGYKKH